MNLRQTANIAQARSAALKRMWYLALLAVVFATGANAPAADRQRLNIVFFLIDDCSTHEFGCYGNKVNPTPNIDRLAESGIRFNAAWACPLCVPTRALLLSGQYGFKTGIYDNAGLDPAKRGDLPNKIMPLSRTLHQAGYATFMGGKWHLDGMPSDKAWGFDEHCLYGSLCEAAKNNRDWTARYAGPWWPPTWPNRNVLPQRDGRGNPYATWYPMIIRSGNFMETGPDDFGPDILSREVADFVRRKAREKKPFFVYYAEHLTHAPHTSMHDPDNPRGETEPGMESNVRYVDRLIGQLVETLKETGVWENTVLMVGGDNPSPTLGKGYAAAIGAHVPLIVSGGHKWVTWQGETGCLTDFADVYPTCMELAGLDPATNPELSGKSLKPLLDGDKAHTRPWIFSYLGIYRMIRDRQWCLDGLDQLRRCNESGNPFTFELVPKDKENAEAARGRAVLEAILKGLPSVPDPVIAANPMFAANREANRAGKLAPQQMFQQLYRTGLERLLANPTRKEGPTRAQIAARSTQPSPASPDNSAPATAPSSHRGAQAEAPKNMVFIPPGKFRMGSPKNEANRYPDESPEMPVTISQGFWMGKYEVTQAEYVALMGTNPSHFTGDPNRPVDSVAWSDATNYCARLTQRERAEGRIPTNLAYRLPTEAEWEYACRAGTTTRFHYGDDPGYTNMTHYAWYRQNAGFMTHPVGQKRPNPWGLYDMYGNVWEWCQDWYGDYPGGAVVDPRGPAEPGMNRQRTMRGADYFNPAQHCRSALRGYDFVPKHPWPPDFGFRVVLAAASPQTEDRPAQSPTAENQPRPKTADGQHSNGVGTGTVQERFNQMAEKLGLSEEQKTRLMDLQCAQYQQMGGLGGQSDMSPAQRMEPFKKFRAELEQKVKESKILTDEQFAKWKEFQSQRFSGGGIAGGATTKPKRTSPAPEKPSQPDVTKPKPAVAPANAAPPTAVKPVANMVWIQPGAFTQGTAKGTDPEAYPDEYPPREVTISKGFWIGRYEVTQEEYLAVIGTNPSFFDGTPRTGKRSGKEFNFGGPNPKRPVDSVSWADAARYCALLTERERAAGKIRATWAYRLPTEAEWDYTVRAGTTTRYHFGDDPDHTLIKQYEWVGVSKAGQDPNTGTAPTQPVGQLKPNPWGLYDMGGNVWEWTLDYYAQFPRSGNPVVDPLSTKSDLQPKHALKGCGANSPPRWARSAARGYDPLDNKGPLHELDLPHTNNYTQHWLPTGFRIVLSETVSGDRISVAPSPPSQASAADPVAAVHERMSPGVQVGHFDHDQDTVPEAEVNAEYLDSVKTAGFKSIRFFHSTNQKPAFYAANVSYALKRGLVVNLCLFANGANTKTKETFANHWRAIAEHYKDYPAELVFEMFNEPALAPKLTDNAAVMEWINAAIAAIREVSPQRILLVGGPQFMQAPFLRFVSPEHLPYELPGGGGFAEDKYIIGAFHMYEPGKYTMPKGKLVTLEELPEWNQQVLGSLDLAAEWTKRWNKRVVMTEWASQSEPKVRSDFLEYTRFVVEEARKRQIGWNYYCGVPRGFLASLGPVSHWSILDTAAGWDQDVLDILTGLKAPPAPAFNLIRNSEFVPGFSAAGGWGLSGWGTSDRSSATQVQNASLSGRNALKIALDGEDISVFQDAATIRIGKAETDGAPQAPGIRLRTGSNYKLTFIARADRDGATVTARLENGAENGVACLASKPFSLDVQQREYAWEYACAGDVPNVRLRLLFSGEKNTVFLDRVMLKSHRAAP